MNQRRRQSRQLDNIAREFRMTAEKRRAFGRSLENEKKHGGGGTAGKGKDPDFTYAELRELARKFLSG